MIPSDELTMVDNDSYYVTTNKHVVTQSGTEEDIKTEMNTYTVLGNHVSFKENGAENFSNLELNVQDIDEHGTEISLLPYNRYVYEHMDEWDDKTKHEHPLDVMFRVYSQTTDGFTICLANADNSNIISRFDRTGSKKYTDPDRYAVDLTDKSLDSMYLELASYDNGDEPIVCRQYNYTLVDGDVRYVVRNTICLLDYKGDTHIENDLYVDKNVHITGNLYVNNQQITRSGDSSETGSSMNLMEKIKELEERISALESK